MKDPPEAGLFSADKSSYIVMDKKFINGKIQFLGHFKGKGEGGVIFIVFDGVDGLS